MSERFTTTQRGLAPGTVCAVLVHYRQPESVRECLYALHELATDLPVIVVENGSRDRSVIALRMLAAEHPTVELVEEKFCHGFSAGANQGIEAALEQYPALRHVLLLDPTTRLRPDFLTRMVDSAVRHPEAGVIGARILGDDGRSTLFGGGRDTNHCLRPMKDSEREGGREIEADFVHLGCCLLDADLLRQGLRFDEGYFAQLEDVDLCRYVRSQGRTVIMRRDAVVQQSECHPRHSIWGRVSELPDEVVRRLAESQVYFARKWLSPRDRTLRIARLTVGEAIDGLLHCLLTLQRPRFLSAWIDGLRDGFAIDLTGEGPEFDGIEDESDFVDEEVVEIPHADDELEVDEVLEQARRPNDQNTWPTAWR